MPAITRSSVLLPRPARPEHADDLAVRRPAADVVEHGPAPPKRTRDVIDASHRRSVAPLARARPASTTTIVSADQDRGEREGLGRVQPRRGGRAGARWPTAWSRARSGQEARGAELAERDRDGEAGADEDGAAQQRAGRRRPCPHRRGAEGGRRLAQIAVDGPQHGERRAHDERDGDQRMAERHEHQRPRRSRGGGSNVISIPKPMVTADVPSGSISPVSSSRPPVGRRRSASAADRRSRWRTPSPPTAIRSDVPMAPAGRTPAASAPAAGRAPEHVIARRRVTSVAGRGTSARPARRSAADHDRRLDGTAPTSQPLAPGARRRACGRRTQLRPTGAVRRCCACRPRHAAPPRPAAAPTAAPRPVAGRPAASPAPDLDLERRLAGSAEHPDDAERREREQEHDRRRPRRPPVAAAAA